MKDTIDLEKKTEAPDGEETWVIENAAEDAAAEDSPVDESAADESDEAESAAEAKAPIDRAIDWLWAKAYPFILGFATALAAIIATGCSGLTPSHKTQTMGVYAMGLPAIAIITQTTQQADNSGEDTSSATQANPISVENDFQN